MKTSPESLQARRRRHSTRLALVLLVAAAGWGGWLAARVGLGVGGYYTDGQRSFEQSPTTRVAIWEPADRASVPTDLTAQRPTVSPDGRLLVFAYGERGLNAELYAAERTPQGWSAPRPLAALNSLADDLAPSFGADALYFASDRGPLGRGLDLWRADWTAEGFAPPQLLAPAVQSDADDTDPGPLGDGRIAFASNRNGLDYDLYLADLEALNIEARAIDELNSPADEREPAAGANGAILWFVSDRVGGAGGFDPYRSFRGRDAWLAPTQVRELASELDERGPWVAPDGFTLWFERGDELERAIHVARSREVYRVPAPPIGWREWVLLGTLVLLAIAAWLSRRYSGLEFVTRCLLASLLLHLALLFWLRHVRPEADRLTGRAEETRYAITLQSAGGASEGERAGQASAAGPTRNAVSQRAPSARAESVRAPQLARASRSEPARPIQPTRAVTSSTVAVQLPTLDAPTPTPEVAAALQPLVTGMARDERHAQPARANAGQPAPHQATATPADPLAGTVRVPLVARAATRAAEPGPIAPGDQRANQSSVGEPVITLPTLATRAAAADDAASGETLQPVALGGRDLQPTRGPARRSTSKQSSQPERSRPTAMELPAEPTFASPRPRAALADEVAALRPGAALRAVPLELPGSSTSAGQGASGRASGSPVPLRSVRFETERELTVRGPRRARSAASAPRSTANAIELERRVARADATAVDVVPVAPLYGNRFGSDKERALVQFGGSRETERSVAEGLRFLASVQFRDGGWGRPGQRHEKYQDVRIGKSGLALLAFLGAGQLPGRDGVHRSSVDRAVAFLLDAQRDNGHVGDCSSYGHGIATYALAEAYALTQLPSLRRPLEAAIEHVLAQQSRSRDARNHGGWGYFTADEQGYRGDDWSRVSITAWQVMALVSARNSGLHVPQLALEDARGFLRRSWDESLGAFRYTHDPNRLRSNYPTLPASTPAALFALSLLGEDVSSEEFREARRFLLTRAPRRLRRANDDAFVFRGDGNLYYWAYATLALFRSGGDAWKRWNAALQEVLLPAQEADGSWPSISIYAEYARDDDRAYSTSLAVLMLEVYYRYVTPTMTGSGVLIR